MPFLLFPVTFELAAVVFELTSVRNLATVRQEMIVERLTSQVWRATILGAIDRDLFALQIVIVNFVDLERLRTITTGHQTMWTIVLLMQW